MCHEDNSALSELELKIQCLLIDFARRHGCKIEHVEVDTRNFGNLGVEVSIR